MMILAFSGVASGQATPSWSEFAYMHCLVLERPQVPLHLFIPYFFSSITHHPNFDAGRDTSACRCVPIPFFLALSAFLLSLSSPLLRQRGQLFHPMRHQYRVGLWNGRWASRM